MAVSCSAMTARSASGKSSRARRATLRTCSISIATLAGASGSNLWGRERFALEWPLYLARPDALYAHARTDCLAFLDHPNALQVRVESPLAGAGNLLTDATEVLGLTAVGLLVADNRLLAAN